jgi:transcriptional antiterminator
MEAINKILKKEFLTLLKQDPLITTPEMAEKLGLSERSIYRYSKVLDVKLTPQREKNAVEYLKSKGYTFIK